MNYSMTREEKDIIDRFERGELRPAPGAAQEIATAAQARNTFSKSWRVNLPRYGA